MAKQIMFDDAARQKMKAGIEKLARTVRVTLGPAGRNVILQKSFGSPHVTKDGVSVAKEIEHTDPFENMGAKLVLEVANKTNDVAGDGTTTATVLASSIFNEGLRFATSGASTIELRNGIDKAVDIAVEAIAGQSRKVKSKDEKASVGTISANNDREIGDLLAEAFEKRRRHRRHHRRGEQGHRDGDGPRRGHGVRQGLPVPVLRHRPRQARLPSTTTRRSSSATRRSRTSARSSRPSRPRCAPASRC